MFKSAVIICFTVLFLCTCLVGTWYAICFIDLHTQMVKNIQAPNTINIHSNKSIYPVIKFNGKIFDINSGLTKIKTGDK